MRIGKIRPTFIAAPPAGRSNRRRRRSTSLKLLTKVLDYIAEVARNCRDARVAVIRGDPIRLARMVKQMVG